jgi:hypothetical protein
MVWWRHLFCYTCMYYIYILFTCISVNSVSCICSFSIYFSYNLYSEHEIKIQFDFGLYNFFRSCVMPLSTLAESGGIRILWTHPFTFLHIKITIIIILILLGKCSAILCSSSVDTTLCDKVRQWHAAVGGFLCVLWFPPPIKLTTTI